MLRTTTITFTYTYDDEEGPTPEKIQEISDKVGFGMDHFISCALVQHTEAQADVIEKIEAMGAEEQADPHGITKKLAAWSESGAPGVVRPRDHKDKK